VRIGVSLPAGHEIEAASEAEGAGVPFVHVTSTPGSEAAVGAAVAATTSAIRIIVGVHIGDENPVTLAEEIAVLDNLSNGRVAVIAELGSLPAGAAGEDVSLLRAALSGRPLGHRGARWQVPAGIAGHVAPASVLVTPAPAQLAVPIWVAGDAAAEVGRSLAIPLVATATDSIDAGDLVCPARCSLDGDLDADRQRVAEWSRAGATHLLCTLDGDATVASLARWLIPEVGMVAFPRVVAEAPLPAAWPSAE
jgi:alkanesulfonate monooxygenase SsuD/methylene tetrahydromethanopterin reductase-like flavin-dependent oxidoreductase (luciferase family)